MWTLLCVVSYEDGVHVQLYHALQLAQSIWDQKCVSSPSVLSQIWNTVRAHMCTAIANTIIKEYIYALLFVRSGVQVYVERAPDLATPHAATSTGQAMVTVSCVSGWNVYMHLRIYCSV